MVYHCLVSTYLNETVEFCGRSVPIAPGNCPIYNYQFFENRVASYYDCSEFTSGCPNQMIHSKHVFKYAECLNIDSEKRCFRSEVQCLMKKSTENITVSTTALNTTDELSTERSITNDVSQNKTRSESDIPYVIREINGSPVWMVISWILTGIVLTVITILFILFISRKRNLLTFLKKRLMGRRQCEEKQNTDKKECTSLLESRTAENNPTDVVVMGASDSTLGSDSGVETEEKQIYREEQRSEIQIDIEDGEKKAGKSIRKLDAIINFSKSKVFTDFLDDLSREMTQGTMNRIKTLLKDRIQESEDDLRDISTPSELLDYMDKELSLYNNLAILQAYFLAVTPPDENLYEKCLSYGKKARDIFYFQKCTENLKDFEKVEFHIKCSDISKYNKADLEEFRKALSDILGVEADDMILVGIRKGSIILTFMIRSTFIPNLRTIFSDRKSLKSITYRVMLFRRLTHRVFKVTINGEVVYEPEKKTEEYAGPTVIEEVHLKRAGVGKYQTVTDKKATQEQCIKFYIENDLEKCQDEVYDLREWIAKYLRIDIGQIMIAGLEKGSVTVVFRVLLGNPETDLMALASTDEFQAGVSRKGVKKIFVGSEKCITVGRAQTFVHIHCSGLHEGNTVDNVKKMVSTVRQKARELVIDGSKVFLRIKDKQKRKEPEIGKKRTGTKERQRLLEELEPTQILRNREVQKVIDGQGINKTLAQSREEKCNIVIDVVDQLPDVTRDVILNSVGEHEESCDETNYTKTSSNKNPVTLPDFETVSEEIYSSIIDETFEKIRYVPSHIKQRCSSASGMKQKERANTLLNYIQENAFRRQIFMMVWQKHVE
ncbi:uncharacterized protein LOC125651212 [Ostrea edulis]|uniref:uncharacterized protein LOC125651212 n=1 Tax=Ostrea edulis TaxID=37623 RepID=UPI0024AEEED3|nr:uncharacterized protein LOC125651212 [Ostrea edulis]